MREYINPYASVVGHTRCLHRDKRDNNTTHAIQTHSQTTRAAAEYAIEHNHGMVNAHLPNHLRYYPRTG